MRGGVEVSDSRSNLANAAPSKLPEEDAEVGGESIAITAKPVCQGDRVDLQDVYLKTQTLPIRLKIKDAKRDERNTNETS